MGKLKRSIVLFISLILGMSLAGCNTTDKDSNQNKYRLTVMTTMFPYYDFTRAVVGDEQDIHVELLMAPGQDSHSFEPSPSEIIQINQADVFIYNGGSIENWVEEVIDASNHLSQVQMRMMDFLNLPKEEEHEAYDAFEEEKEHHHADEVDEHIWTSPAYAMILVQKICDKLCELVPEKEKVFRTNTAGYIQQLTKVDNQFKEIVKNARCREMIFADRFPLKYFADEYGLKYYAAFPGCSGDTEPSAKKVAFLIDKVKEKNASGVFYLELSSEAMADVICDDTSAEKYQFHSCHNITRKQFDEGVTYIDLMKENAVALQLALN